MWLISAVLYPFFWVLILLVSFAGRSLDLSETGWEIARAACALILAMTAWWLFQWKRPFSFRSLGYATFRWQALILVGGLLLVNVAFNACFLGLLVEWARQGVLHSASMSLQSGLSPAEIAGLVIRAPLWEEYIFRGLLFTGFRRHYGAKKAALISAFIFAVFHVGVPFPISQFFGGILLAAIYDETKSMWPPMLLHGAWNGLVTALAP